MTSIRRLIKANAALLATAMAVACALFSPTIALANSYDWGFYGVFAAVTPSLQLIEEGDSFVGFDTIYPQFHNDDTSLIEYDDDGFVIRTIPADTINVYLNGDFVGTTDASKYGKISVSGLRWGKNVITAVATSSLTNRSGPSDPFTVYRVAPPSFSDQPTITASPGETITISGTLRYGAYSPRAGEPLAGAKGILYRYDGTLEEPGNLSTVWATKTDPAPIVTAADGTYSFGFKAEKLGGTHQYFIEFWHPDYYASGGYPCADYDTEGNLIKVFVPKKDNRVSAVSCGSVLYQWRIVRQSGYTEYQQRHYSLTGSIRHRTPVALKIEKWDPSRRKYVAYRGETAKVGTTKGSGGYPLKVLWGAPSPGRYRLAWVAKSTGTVYAARSGSWKYVTVK